MHNVHVSCENLRKWKIRERKKSYTHIYIYIYINELVPLPLVDI